MVNDFYSTNQFDPVFVLKEDELLPDQTEILADAVILLDRISKQMAELIRLTILIAHVGDNKTQ